MDKNKSIDGLTIRRPKNTSTSTKVRQSSKSSSKSQTTSKKTTNKSIVSPKTTTKTTIKKTAPKPRTKTTTNPKPQTKTKSRKNQKITPTSAPSHPSTPPTSEANDLLFDEPLTTENLNQDIIDDFLKPVQAFDFDEQTGQLTASESPIHEKPKKFKKEKKPISKKRKIITGIILTIVILLIGTVVWFIIWGNSILNKITGGQGNIFDLFSEHYEPLKKDANGRTNILAIGTSGFDMEGSEGDNIHDGAQLTDSIMVISLNQETGDVAMLSLPRDLKVASTCTATSKINEVYWCNNMEGDNEQAGAEALMKDVGDILDVDFQYYAHLNWGSLVQIVDTLGGVTVTLDEDIEDYYYTGAVYKADTPYTITGMEAVALARARHGTASGDFSRGASQQKILIGIKDKIFEKQLSLGDIISIASTLGDNLRTNFSVDELKTAAHLTSEFDFNSIRQVSLLEPEPLMTTGTINGISYVLPVGGASYYTRIQEFIAKMFSNNPSDYENASILVLNGTETPGLAATEEKTLEEAGFSNIIIDDAPDGTYSETYTLYTLDDTTPGTKKLLEEKYSITSKTYEELPVGISQDYNFVVILGGTNNDSN